MRHRVGQVMTHAQYGYRGVVYGWTPTCQASQEWIQQMNVDALPGACAPVLFAACAGLLLSPPAGMP